MRKFTPADYRVMPWKNGGGETTELYVEPDPDGAGFLWRISIATVAMDGPFSLFEGYVRHIMTIEGNGILLSGGPDGPIDVSPKFHPRKFSGDWAVASRLIDGPVRDFNLISKRERFESNLETVELAGTGELGHGSATTFIHLLDGELEIAADSIHIETGDSLLIEPGRFVVLANIASRPSHLAAARLFALG